MQASVAAQTGKVHGLTPFEVTVTCGHLAGNAPHLRALATIVPPEELWRLCREELQGRDLEVDGWIIKPRWSGIAM